MTSTETLLGIAGGEIEVAAEHKLVAPTLVRSPALSALYEAARRSEISAGQGIERVTQINSLNVCFLGDKVLQRRAWEGRGRTRLGDPYDAEFVALTPLQPTATAALHRHRPRADLERYLRGTEHDDVSHLTN